MFGIDTEKCVSFFRKGVELLAEISTNCQFSEQQVSQPKGFDFQIKTANAASRSSLYGSGKPRHCAFKWAGHGIPSFEQRLSQFWDSLAKFFFPHRCSGELASQAMAASRWLHQTESWQGMPWYGRIVGHVNLFMEPDVARQQTHWQIKGQL